MNKNNSTGGNREPKWKGVFAFLAWIATPAGLAALSPWYLPLLDISLFPDYFAPLPKVFGSTVFLISLLTAMGFHRRTSQERMRRFLLRWIITCVLTFVACFVATQVFSNHWLPDASWEILVHPVWLLVFATVFASMAF